MLCFYVARTQSTEKKYIIKFVWGGCSNASLAKFIIEFILYFVCMIIIIIIILKRVKLVFRFFYILIGNV